MPIFQNLMHHLHPKVIIEKVEQPHDTARGKYVLNSSIVRSYAEFEKEIINYTDHHIKEIYGNPFPPDLVLGKARNYLENSMNFKNAVFTGMSGTDGGMNNVLNNIADGFKQEAKKAYFQYIIDSFVDPLNFSQVVELMREFKNKLGAYSSQPFSFVEPESMASDYESIIWQYIDSLSKHKHLWSY